MKNLWVVTTFFALFTLKGCLCEEEPSVTGVTPTLGSLNGGTRITLSGTGFSTTFDLNGDENVGNRVYLVSGTTQYSCDIHQDGCTRNQLTCYTRPMPSTRYYVQVYVDGVAFPLNAHCGHSEGRSSRCSFYPQQRYSPEITEVLTPYGQPDDLVTAYGKIFTDKYGTNVELGTNNVDAKFLRLWLTDRDCKLVDDISADIFYGLALDTEDSMYGTFTCKPQGTLVGYRNHSFIIDGHYGRSVRNLDTMKVGRDNTLYMLQTYATITEVSHQTGSEEGGTPLTITGKFFDDTQAPIEVLVGDEPCTEATLESRSADHVTEITCLSPANHAVSGNKGDRGIIVELWQAGDVVFLTADQISNLTDTPTNVTWYDEFHYEDNVQNRFVTRAKGYFVAPQTSEYAFFLRTDDGGTLYVSEDGNPENKVEAAVNVNANYGNVENSAISQRYSLVKDQEVYLEVVHTEWAGNSGVRVAAHMYDTVYNARHSGQVKNEISRVATTSVTLNEIQELRIHSSPSGSGVQEQQTFTLTSSSQDAQEHSSFQIEILGFRTVIMPADSSSSTIKDALNSLPFIDSSVQGGDTFTVEETTGSNILIRSFTVTFPNHKGTYGDMDVHRIASSDLQITTSIARVGKSSGMYLNLQMYNSLSTAVAYSDISTSKIASAVTTMLSVRCPLYVTRPSGAYSFTQDFERVTNYEESGERTNEVAPFCGRYSIKNPGFVYNAGSRELADGSDEWKTGISSDRAPIFCFAFRGIVQDYLYLYYKYNGDEGMRGDYIDMSYYLDENSASISDYLQEVNTDGEDWRYRCINLLHLTQDRHTFVTSMEVLQVKIFNAAEDSNLDPLYVDTLTFTSKVPSPSTSLPVAHSQNVREINSLITEQRMVPTKWLLDVAVVSSNDSLAMVNFRIDMTILNCENDFELMRLAHADVTVSNDETSSSYQGLAGSQVTVHSIERATGPVSGRFHLNWESYSLNNLDVYIEANNLAGAITALSDSQHEFGHVKVTRSGTCSGYTWYIEHTGKGGDHPNLELTGVSNLQPSSASVTADTLQDGGVMFDPIPGDLISTGNWETPQVRVNINGMRSLCLTDCGFEWTAEDTPTLSASTPTSGTSGDTLTLTGTGFSTTAAENQVMIGGTACTATASTNTSITCTLGQGPAGDHPIVLTVTTKGLARHNGGPFNFLYEFAVDSISHSTGSLAGGRVLTVSGSGFSTNTVIKIGDNVCEIQGDVTYDSIVCEVPAGAALGAVTVTAENVDLPTATGPSFTYVAPVGTITSVDVTTAALEGGTAAVIQGTGFRDTGSQTLTVGGQEVTITDYTETRIDVIWPAHSKGSYAIHLRSGDDGFDDNGGFMVNYYLEVNNVYPTSGSIMGGSLITLTGKGFSIDPDNNNIMFGDAACDPIITSFTQVVCQLGFAAKTHTVTNDGFNLDISVSGYAWFPQYLSIEQGDKVHFEWSLAEHVSDVGIRVFQTANMSSESDLSGGFGSGTNKVKNGEYDYQFWNTGGDTTKEFTYWSGYVNANEDLFFFGKVDLRERTTDRYLYLSYMIGSEEADYVFSGGNPSSGACTDNTPPGSGCLDLSNDEDLPHFNFASRMCQTATIQSVSPSEIDATEEIVITGEGFSTSCDNEVILEKGVYNIPCNIQSSSATQIRCIIDSSCNSMPAGVPLSVDVRVANLGYAAHAREGTKENHAVHIRPHVSGVSPSVGSTQGGLQTAISGGNFIYDPENVCTGDRKKRSAASDALQDMGGVYSYSISIPGCSSVEVVDPQTLLCTTIASTSSVNLLPTVTTLTGTFTSGCTGVGTCTLVPNSALTPTVTAVANHPITATGQQLTITGTGFGTDSGQVIVSLGDAVCVIDSGSFMPTEITCEVDVPEAGTHTLAVLVTTIGLAYVEPAHSQIMITGSISSVSPDPVGLGGGLAIDITGFGFHDDDTEVTIAGEPCDVQSVTVTSITCKNPAVGAGTHQVVVTTGGHSLTSQIVYEEPQTPTVDSVSPTKAAAGSTLTIAGDNFGSVQADVAVTVGSANCAITAFSDSSISCTLGAHVAGPVSVEVLADGRGLAVANVAGALDFAYALEFSSISPSTGSTGGGQTVAVAGSGFDPEGTSLTICNQLCELVEGSESMTGFSCVTPADAAVTGATCDAVLTLANGQSVTLSNSYLYQTLATITAVDPRDAGTGGGKTITITGSGFGTDEADVTVFIAGTECTIQTIVDDEITCETGAHKPAVKTQVEVRLTSQGIAYQGGNADFEYIDLWSSIYTWNGEPLPVEGDLVVIPADMVVRLDIDTPPFKVLLLQGGTVEFDGEDRTLRAEIIMITDGGTLRAGTEDSPYENKAVIELHGHVRSKELPIYGTKNIALREGILDLHGKSKGLSWTQLAQTANAGDTTMELEGNISGWEVGDHVAIASTGDHFSQGENEERIIASISGQVVTLTEALEYTHLGEEIPFGNQGRTLSARAEVGVLTRTVVVTGTDNPEWHDEIEACEAGFDPGEFAKQTCFQGRFGEEIGSEQFGGQIITHSPQKANNESEIVAFVRLSNVELDYMGQAFRLGRYALHFHINGDMTGSYVKNCAIHHSNNRAVNVHATNYLLIEDNVAFDVMGGAFFLEDGVEIHNTFKHNLAIFVISSTSLQNDDITPAAFWITNALNNVLDNHAAGGSHFGFWYRMHEHPDGPSFDANYYPRRVPMGEFSGNVVHSQGWFAVWVFMVYTPMTLVNPDGSGYSTTPEGAVFDSLTGWNCEKGFESVGGGAIQVTNSLFVNSEISGMEFKLVLESTPYSETEGTMVSGTTIVGKLDALDRVNDDAYVFGVTLPQGRGLILKDMTYVGFSSDKGCVYTVANIQGVTITFCGAYTYWGSGHEYDDTDCITAWRWAHDGVIDDLDGTVSLSGEPHTKLLPAHGDLPDPGCLTDPLVNGLDFSGGVAGAVCEPEHEFHRFALNQYSPSSLEGKNLSFTNMYGSQDAYYADKSTTHPEGWRALLLSNVVYAMEFVNAGQITNLSYHGVMYDFAEDQWNVIEHHFYQNPDRFSITEIGDRDMSPSSLDASSNRYGDWFIPLPTVNSEGRHVYQTGYLIDGEIELPYDENTTLAWAGHVDRYVDAQVYRCFYADCFAPLPFDEAPVPLSRPSNYVLWSNASIWSYDSNGYAVADRLTGNFDDTPLPDGNATKLFINKDSWVVLDVSPGHAFQEVTIYGTLEFEWALPVSIKKGTAEPMTLEFTCTHLFLSGGRVFVGMLGKPMLNNVIINLAGNQFTPDKVIGNGGPNMGAKAIGVFGGLEMHGKSVGVTWTRLATTALAGMQELRLDTATDVDDIGWQVGDQVVVTGTGFAPGESEVHTITGFRSRSNSVLLDGPLMYTHSGETVIDLGGGNTMEIAAEVGLLSRNIQIRGVNHPDDVGTSQDMYETGFGGRVIVGEYNLVNDDNELEIYTGYARINNVQFVDMGQEGWNEFYDPRFALAYLNTRDVTDIKPSEVKGCSFQNNFNSALGVFGTYGMDIVDNVVYRTVGSSMIIWESDQLLKNNLVIGMTYPGTFNGRNEQRDTWYAVFEINQTPGLRLEGNVAADYERGGYRIDGETCEAACTWTNNVAHTGLIGVYMLGDTRDGLEPCARVCGFYAYHNWDWGMYLQTPGSLELANNVLIENTVGTFPIIYEPPSKTHATSDKYVLIEDSYYVGQTSLFDCNDVLDAENFGPLLEFSATARSWFIDERGMTGAAYPSFMSGPTGSPRKPFNGIISYHTINGMMTIRDTTFYQYGMGCSDSRNYAITPPDSNDDGIFPTYLENVGTVDVDTNSLFHNHRPQTGKIDPSNCVDMHCDGLKKVILKDSTGDFLGTAGTTLVSESEWEWDGNPVFGLGDYRIPKVLQTELDGTRIPMSEVAQQRGIVRNSACELVESYQAWRCEDMDHELLHLESLDADTETRRISPIAIQGPLTSPDLSNVRCVGTADQPCYVDLVNGPQDHGWCMGYTCQKRLSLFPIVLSPGEYYHIVPTGTTPQNLALHWLNTDDTQAAVVGIHFSRPWRLDVYHGTEYVPPTNMDPMHGVNDLRLLRPINDGDWMPDVTTDRSGTNYLDREEQFLYVNLRGSTPVTIKTIDTIFVNFDMPMMTVDEFFGPEIVNNLASFFDIPPEKIRVATAVKESRKKRQDILQVFIEISNNPANLTADIDPSDLTHEQLANISASIMATYQLGEMDEVLGLEIVSFTLVEPPPSSDSETWQVMAELGSSPAITAIIPVTLEFESELESLHEGSAFSTQPVLRMLDTYGDVISSLGTIAAPWEITASLYEVESEWDQAALIGSETVQYQDGQFVFTDLGVSHSGSYRVTFTVTYPAEASHFSLDSQDFTSAERDLAAGIVSLPEMLTAGEEFNVTVEIVDGVTGEKVEDIAWKGHTWGCSVSLYMPDMYMGSLTVADDTANVDVATGEAMFYDLSITKYGRYFLAFDFMSDPSDLGFAAPADLAVDVYPEGYMNPEREVLHHIILKFDGDYGAVVQGVEKYFHAAVYNNLWYAYVDVAFSNFDSEAGSILVSFDVAGTRDSLDSMVDDLWEQIEEEEYSIEFNGQTLMSTGDMWVDGENLKEEKDKMHLGLIIVIVVLCVLLVGTIIGFVIYKYCKSKANNSMKLEKREPTATRRKTGGPVTGDYYHTVGMPDSRSDSSLSSGSHDNEEKPIIAAVPPKSTNFDFLNVRPKSSYKPPGALPPLQHRGPTNQDSRPISTTYLDIAVVANPPGGGLPRVDTPEN